MKRLILGAMGLCLIASTALAQSDAPPPPPPVPAQGDAADMPPPPEGPKDQARAPGGGEARDAARDDDWDHGPRRKGPHGWRHKDGPPPSKAAEFDLRRGPLAIRVKCSEDEATKACIDGAIALMRELGTLRGPNRHGEGMHRPPPPPEGGQQPGDRPQQSDDQDGSE